MELGMGTKLMGMRGNGNIASTSRTSTIQSTDRLTSSADSAKKKPCVLDSMMKAGPGLMASELSAPASPRPSTAISSSFSLLKHSLYTPPCTQYYTRQS